MNRAERLRRFVEAGLYVITAQGLSRGRAHEEVLEGALAGGARLIQLRAKGHSDADLLDLGRRVRRRCAEAGALFIMNDRPDLAAALEADGVHVGQEDEGVERARALVGPDQLIGVSAAGSLEVARAAEAAGADYVAAGSMFPTTTKADAVVRGVDVLRRMKAAVSIPVVAIGGITHENVDEVLLAGADAVCVISAVADAEDVAAATRQLLERIHAWRAPLSSAPLESSVEEAVQGLQAKHAARDQALTLHREVIRFSANAIRAVHRGELRRAEDLLREARARLDQIEGLLASHPDVYYAGFVHDCQKEYAEAFLTLAQVARRPIPTAQDLGVGHPAYLNGLAESIGEMRRLILDLLRQGRYDGCEDLLQRMDDIYSLLVTVDFPDAITGGLRRNTDAMRAVLERTRGDLTLSLQQQRLEMALRH